MIVLHIIGGIDRFGGGPSRSSQGLVAGLRAAGVDAWLMTLMKSESPWINGVDRFINGGAFEDALAEVKPDVVHLHGIWQAELHRCAVVCRRWGIPYVIAPRGMLEPWSLKQKWLKKRVARWLYQDRDLKKAAALHATAESEAENIRRLGFANYIIVSPNGVNVPEGEVEGWRLKVEGTGSEVEGGRDEVEGGRDEVEGGRSEVEGGRDEAEVGRDEAEGGRSEVEGGRDEVEGGRDEVECGRDEVEGGRWEVGQWNSESSSCCGGVDERCRGTEKNKNSFVQPSTSNLQPSSPSLQPAFDRRAMAEKKGEEWLVGVDDATFEASKGKMRTPRLKPLSEVVEAVAKHQAAGFSPSTTKRSIANWADGNKGVGENTLIPVFRDNLSRNFKKAP